MFKKNINNNITYFFPDSSSIHTFFMKFSIDVIYLKKIKQSVSNTEFLAEGVYTGSIVKIVENLKPYRFSVSLKADSLLELKSPAGLLKNLNINDILTIQ